MTNEQYYWFVRRPQMLKAYAAANNMHLAAVAAGEGDTSIPVTEPEEAREAFIEAKDGDVIKIAAPITLSKDEGDGQAILIDKNLGVNLNNTIAATTLAGNTADAVFAVTRGGTLTIGGSGTVDGTGSATQTFSSNGTNMFAAANESTVWAAIKTTVKGEALSGDVATLVVNGGTYKGKYYAICGNGSRQNTDVTINAGTFEGTEPNDNMAIFHPENGKLVINNGTFKGNDGVVVKSGNITINNGTFEANGPAKEFKHSKSGWNCTGDCIIVEACDYPGLIPTVVINGGTFSSVNGKPVVSYTQDATKYPRVTKFVKGGKFNKALDADLIAEGYHQVEEDGWFVVKPL